MTRADAGLSEGLFFPLLSTGSSGVHPQERSGSVFDLTCMCVFVPPLSQEVD